MTDYKLGGSNWEDVIRRIKVDSGAAVNGPTVMDWQKELLVADWTPIGRQLEYRYEWNVGSMAWYGQLRVWSPRYGEWQNVFQFLPSIAPWEHEAEARIKVYSSVYLWEKAHPQWG